MLMTNRNYANVKVFSSLAPPRIINNSKNSLRVSGMLNPETKISVALLRAMESFFCDFNRGEEAPGGEKSKPSACFSGVIYSSPMACFMTSQVSSSSISDIQLASSLVRICFPKFAKCFF